MDELGDTIELLRRAKSGDRRSLDQLLHRYRVRLLERIRLMMGPAARQVAESSDFLQDVIVDITGGLERFEIREERSFLRWAVRIARNRIVDAVRKPREQAVASFSAELRRQVARDATPFQEAASRSDVEHLLELLESLTKPQRLVLELRHFDGLPFRVIGERMGRSENAAQLLHAQALTALGELARRHPE